MARNLQILRCSLHLLSNACETSKRGQIQFQVVRNSTPRGQKDELIFECRDSRALTQETKEESLEEEQRHKCLFASLDIASHGLDLGCKQGHNLHGTMSPRRLQGVDANGNPVTKQGTYAWFSIPLLEPPQASASHKDPTHSTSKAHTTQEHGSKCSVEDPTIRPISRRDPSTTDGPGKYQQVSNTLDSVSNRSIPRRRDWDDMGMEISAHPGCVKVQGAQGVQNESSSLTGWSSCQTLAKIRCTIAHTRSCRCAVFLEFSLVAKADPKGST